MSDLTKYNFNADDHDTSDNFQPIPAGLYKMMIESSEVVSNKAKTGEILKLTFSILEGKFTGKKLFENINISNPNAQCVEIGLKALAQIGKAVKIPRPSDSAQLHNLPLMGRVAVVKDTYTGPDALKNELKAYSPIGEVSQGQAAPAAAPYQKPAAQATSY